MADHRQQLETRLLRFGRVRTGVANATVGLRLSRVILGSLAAGLILLGGWIGNPFLNLGIAAVVATVILVVIVRILITRERVRSAMREAFHLEALAGDLNSRVVSALSFLEEGETSTLTQAVIARAVTDVDAPHEDKLDREPRNRWAKHATAWLVVVLILGVTPWFGFANAWQTVGSSWREAMARLFPVTYVMDPAAGEHIYRVGATVDISVVLNKPTYSEATLVQHLGDDDEAPVTEIVPFDAGARAATSIVGDVAGTREVYFRFGDQQTESLHITFAELPAIVNMQTELIYPSYTRLLPRTLEGIQSRVLGLDGTRMSLGFTFSKELESATITWDDGSELPLEILGRYASIGLIHNRARQASLQVRDRHGFELEFPVIIDFQIQTDERPEVAMPRHLKDDMPMLPEMAAAFGFAVRARDDYGVSRTVLSWQKVSVDNPNAVLDSGEIERLISPPRRKVTVSFDGVFATTQLVPGDKIVFKVDVYDNRAPDAQKASTPRRSFFIYQEELDDLSIKGLGFGSMSMASSRINKSKRATTVKAPTGERTAEKVRNEFDGVAESRAIAPNVRGEYRDATQDYFQVLSRVAAGGDGETKAPAESSGPAVPTVPGGEPETNE